uniref:Gnk2-homologous domain-containing protein n=1 Tax=Fagus sylvatica TaxID=28930 RepID=A0A2N9HU11_FAGSY
MPNSTPNSTTPNELYVTNLNELSTYLNYEISSTGFALGTKGQGADKVYGVALCRGDLSDTDCKYDQSITQRKGDWLSKLAGQASGTPQMFSSGELDLGNNSKLYGSVQCTRDLLSIDCSNCLNDSIGFLPKCCDMASGVHMYSGTCNVRFETFKYYNA